MSIRPRTRERWDSTSDETKTNGRSRDEPKVQRGRRGACACVHGDVVAQARRARLRRTTAKGGNGASTDDGHGGRTLHLAPLVLPSTAAGVDRIIHSHAGSFLRSFHRSHVRWSLFLHHARCLFAFHLRSPPLPPSQPCATVSVAPGPHRTNSSGSLLGLPLHPPTSRELTSSLLDAEGTHEPEGEGERGARWRQPGHTNWHRQTRGGAAWQVRGRVRGAPSDVRRSKRPHVDPKGCREGWRRGPASRGPRQMSSPCTIEKPREEIDRSSRRKTSTRANATGCWTSANPRTKTANPARAEARNPPP